MHPTTIIDGWRNAWWTTRPRRRRAARGRGPGRRRCPGCPDSMRESSVTRSSPDTAVAVVTVRPPGRPLDDADLRVGLRRHLGQVGHDQHLAAAGPPRAGPRPRASAAAPPTPASTSSKTMVWGPPMPDQADGEHGPGQLAAGAGPGQRLHRLADVGPQGELDRLARPVGRHPHLQAGPGHGQRAPGAPRPGRPKSPAARARTERTAASASASSARRSVALGLQPSRLALGVLERGQAGRPSRP